MVRVEDQQQEYKLEGPLVCGSSQGITEIEQVSTHIIQVYWGPMGVIAWNTFVLRVEHDYIMVSKSEKSLDMGEFAFHAEITMCY